MTILLSILFSLTSWASTSYSVGTFVSYFGRAQTNTQGKTQVFDLNPYFGIGTQFALMENIFFTPEIAIAFYTSVAKKTNKRTTFLHYNFGSWVTNKLLFRYGLTTYWYTISGEGGSLSLRNGDSFTNFDAPSKAKTSRITTLDIGAEYFLKTNLAIRLDFNRMAFLNRQKAAWSYIFTLNFYR